MTHPVGKDEATLIPISEVLRHVGRRSRTTVYALMRRDPSFPRPVQGTSEQSIAWYEHEIIRWVKGRPRVALTGVSVIESRQAMRKQVAVI